MLFKIRVSDIPRANARPQNGITAPTILRRAWWPTRVLHNQSQRRNSGELQWNPIQRKNTSLPIRMAQPRRQLRVQHAQHVKPRRLKSPRSIRRTTQNHLNRVNLTGRQLRKPNLSPQKKTMRTFLILLYDARGNGDQHLHLRRGLRERQNERNKIRTTSMEHDVTCGSVTRGPTTNYHHLISLQKSLKLKS